MSNQRPPDLNQVYRTFQQAHNTEGQVIELLTNEVTRLTQENIEMRAKIMEFEKPVKKVETSKK